MPKELRPSTNRRTSHPVEPYPAASTSQVRNAAIWSTADDEVLLRARAEGLNWGPIARTHFPNKTANACRKRHERLIERRNVEDWDAERLEMLAQHYLAVRREMWEILAARVGERWNVVETKCMEKGLKNLQSAARTAQRRASTELGPPRHERGISEHNSDSGIGLGGSDTEMEVGVGRPSSQHAKSASWHGDHRDIQHSQSAPPDHGRSRSLPQPLPLYQPPAPIPRTRRALDLGPVPPSPEDTVLPTLRESFMRYSPESHGRSGVSIQSMLST